MTTSKIMEKLYALKPKSAWDNGVRLYALEILEGTEEEITGTRQDELYLLNGAENWMRYSDGACSMVYDEDIAKRLCTPSALYKSKNGYYNPNRRENWIQCQARALQQAWYLIKTIAQEEN